MFEWIPSERVPPDQVVAILKRLRVPIPRNVDPAQLLDHVLSFTSLANYKLCQEKPKDGKRNGHPVVQRRLSEVNCPDYSPSDDVEPKFERYLGSVPMAY